MATMTTTTTTTTNVVSLLSLLLGSLLIRQSCDARPSDWSRQLEDDIQKMVHNVEENVRQLTTRINHQVNQLTQSTLMEIGNLNNGGYVPNNANVIITNGDGELVTVFSGVDNDGQPFVRNVTQKRVGNIIYHNETYYNPYTGKKRDFRYSVDLSKPDSKPVILENQK